MKRYETTCPKCRTTISLSSFASSSYDQCPHCFQLIKVIETTVPKITLTEVMLSFIAWAIKGVAAVTILAVLAGAGWKYSAGWKVLGVMAGIVLVLASLRWIITLAVAER